MWWNDNILNNAMRVAANPRQRSFPGQGNGATALRTGYNPLTSPFGYPGEAFLGGSNPFYSITMASDPEFAGSAYGAPPIPDILFTVAGDNNAPLRGTGP